MTWGGEEILGLHNWWHGVSKVKAVTQKTAAPLRIGVLGAAAINYAALFDPVAYHSDAVVAAIASRSADRITAQITSYKLGHAIKQYTSYEELINDPDIDAVYIALPNGLHHIWAISSLRAGKHVLIEKPMAANVVEVERIRKTCEETNRIALEALHWRFHPAAHMVRALCQEYGYVQSICARMGLPAGALKDGDIRFRYDLGGGAAMDLNYVFSACCYFASPNIEDCDVEVLEATAKLNPEDAAVDEKMNATFVLRPPNAPPVSCAIEADHQRPMKYIMGIIPNIMDIVPPLTIELEGARIEFPNFPGPWVLCRITVTEKDNNGHLTNKKRSIAAYEDGPDWGNRGARHWTTYRYQLEAFVDCIRANERQEKYSGPWVSIGESAKLMSIIDAVYRKSGLPPRGH